MGHTLVLGATGTGKSFSLNFLLVQALQYDPRVLILNLGGSYRWLTQFLDGGYMELSPDGSAASSSLPGGYRACCGSAGGSPGEKTPARFPPASKTFMLSRRAVERSAF